MLTFQKHEGLRPLLQFLEFSRAKPFFLTSNYSFRILCHSKGKAVTFEKFYNGAEQKFLGNFSKTWRPKTSSRISAILLDKNYIVGFKLKVISFKVKTVTYVKFTTMQKINFLTMLPKTRWSYAYSRISTIFLSKNVFSAFKIFFQNFMSFKGKNITFEKFTRVQSKTFLSIFRKHEGLRILKFFWTQTFFRFVQTSFSQFHFIQNKDCHFSKIYTDAQDKFHADVPKKLMVSKPILEFLEFSGEKTFFLQTILSAFVRLLLFKGQAVTFWKTSRQFFKNIILLEFLQFFWTKTFSSAPKYFFTILIQSK